MKAGVIVSALALLLPACVVLKPVPPLRGTTWVLVELQGEPFVSPSATAFTLQLKADGRLQAFAGCNDLQGDYSLPAANRSEGRLRLGPFDLLPGLCAPEVAALERKVIHAMEGGSRYRREADGRLSVLNPVDIPLLRLAPAAH